MINIKNSKKGSIVGKSVLVILLLVLGIFFVKNVLAYPPMPTEFYGSVKTFNTPALSGVITAYYGNVSCGTFTIVHGGYYGVLSCLGKNTESGDNVGGVNGGTITFEYNGQPATATGDNIFTSGYFKYVNITNPIVVCGDGFCDSLEDCSGCEVDCQACNFTGNTSGNASGNGSSNQSTGGGEPGGGAGGGGGGGGGAGGGGAAPIGTPPSCTERWACGNWSDCFVIGLHNRSCTDSARCGTYNSKPKEVEDCTYLGTCFDNLINCHDGKCEEGLDCGGTCEKKCPISEQPSFNVTIKLPKLEIPTQVCERKIDVRDPAMWIFLLIVIASIVGRMIYTRYLLKKLDENENLTPLERSRKILSTKRKTTLFTITLIFLTAVSFLYSYYFLLCPSDFIKYSWMLAVLIALIPFVINAVMKKYEYSESKHLYKAKFLEDSHYAHLVKLIEMENSILADEENAIANRLYELSKKEEFKNFMDEDENIKEIYKNLVKLYTEYKDKKNLFNVERIVCDEINALDSDILFQSQLVKHPELKHIFDRLKKLYGQYEEKQKLYDKLDELEQQEKKDKEERENKKDKKGELYS